MKNQISVAQCNNNKLVKYYMLYKSKTQPDFPTPNNVMFIKEVWYKSLLETTNSKVS